MADVNHRTRFRLWLWLIATIGVIVPRTLRADWRQEWNAELNHREGLLAEWDRLTWQAKLDLFRRSVGAFWDALLLQPRRLEDEMFQDLRFGSRLLVKTPGFTLAAIITLALGIGACTAIFSAVNPVLFEPLPYPNAGRITTVWDHGPDNARQEVTFGTFREVFERTHSFDSLAVTKPWQPTITGPAERLDGQRVSASYFVVLGVPPAFGREFDSTDDRVNGPKVVLLSHALWQRRFGGDQAIVGRQLVLDDYSYTVIGVMPHGFENVPSPKAELWTPLQYDMSMPGAWGHHLQMLGRLRAEIGTDQARRELDEIAGAPVPEFQRPPWAAVKNGFIVSSLQDDVTRAVKPALLAVLGAMMLVLIIACVNVTNLLLARGAGRRGEFALRSALGAERMRMIRQLLTESLLLAILGGGLGSLVAQFGVQALVALSPPGLPRVSAIRLDPTVLIFGMVVTTVIGIAVGLVPALHASRTDLTTGLNQGSQRTSGGHQMTRRTLVVAEVALALVLLVSAGLLFVSLRRLITIDPGFDPSNLLTVQVQTSGRRFDKEAADRFFRNALEAVRRVPGVTGAEVNSQLPLSEDRDEYGAHFEGDDPNIGYSSFRYSVSPGYFELMKIPLRMGRYLDSHDLSGGPLSVVTSESLARRKFQDLDPIGKRVHLGPANGPIYTVVGVVGDVKQASLAAPQSDAFYTTPDQWRFGDQAMSLIVRVPGNSIALVAAIREAIWSVDKDQPIVRIATMGSLVERSGSERRFALILFETFALVALVLAATGIYGVLSGSVTERTREIGVRLALGAQRRDVLKMILRQGLVLTVSGVSVGLIVAWAVTRLLAKLLYGVSATDPSIFVGGGVLLTIVALAACYVPARRATRVDPLVALRHE